MAVAGYEEPQVRNAAIIADVAHGMGLGDRGALLGVMCAMGESSLRNIDYGDWETNGVRNPDGSPTSSIGLFQQQKWWGTPAERMDARYAAGAFLAALVKVRDWATLPPTLAIHRAQINADPNHYSRYESPARAVLAHIADRRAKGGGLFMAAPVIEWVRDGVGFTPDAAASFRRAEADWGSPIRCNSTYRDWDEQMGMYLAWNAWVQGRGPKPNHSRAVHPDESRHTSGIALDTNLWTVPGFIAFMADRGWIRTAAWDPTEQHHFEYQWWRDNHRDEPAPAGGNAIPIQEDDMFDDNAKKDAADRHAAQMRELSFLRPLKLYALVDENGAGGWVWIGPSGRWWTVPSIAYAALVEAQKLSQGAPIRAIQKAEFDFLTGQLLGGLVPDGRNEYRAEVELSKILTLDTSTVERIVDGIKTAPLVLTADQFKILAEAIGTAARADGETGAVKALTELTLVASTA